MSSLDELLDDPAVEVTETVTELGPAAFERRLEVDRTDWNRAVSGVVRDADDRLLLVRRSDGWDGWLLPGSDVGSVTDFEPRLREELTELLGDCIAEVEPMQVRKQTGERDGETASLYYVLCEVELEGPPREVVEEVETDEGVELAWFSETPDDAVNPGVIDGLLNRE